MTQESESSEPKSFRRAPTGIAGFDVITGGGLPIGQTVLLLGSPGAGKTVFALQTLVNGAHYQDEASVFVTFEERPSQLLRNHASFDWGLAALVDHKIHLLDGRPDPQTIWAGSFDLSGMLATIDHLVQTSGATRVVFDAIDAVLDELGDPVVRRRELYRIHDWIAGTDLSCMLTAKSDTAGMPLPRDGDALLFISDCVVALHNRLGDRVHPRAVQIVKFRGSGHAQAEFPLSITEHGIDVHAENLDEIIFRVSAHRVSTGILRLDTMLAGGLHRGSSMLVSGEPGTSKTSLSACFAAAACERDERVLYVSFDESGPQITRNMSSIGLDMGRHESSGLLRYVSLRADNANPEDPFVSIRRIIENFDPAALIVDPLSALARPAFAHGKSDSVDVARRLVDYAKARGITVVCTSLLDSHDQGRGRTPVQVSTIVDTWIRLSYNVYNGERNRALSIIKSRGTAHSNQVRELVLNSDGITLADVYSAGGEVLMGSARVEREVEDEQREQIAKHDYDQQRRQLERLNARTVRRLEALQLALDDQARSLDRLNKAEQLRQQRQVYRVDNALQQRKGDRDQEQKAGSLSSEFEPESTETNTRGGTSDD